MQHVSRQLNRHRNCIVLTRLAEPVPACMLTCSVMCCLTNKLDHLLRTCRYYRGRHFLQERSRSAKRINLASLQHRRSSSSALLQRNSTSTLLMPPTTPLLPPAKAGTAAASTGGSLHGGPGAAHMQEQHAGSSRRLAIPAPAFIPLEAPQELLQQSEQQEEGVRAGDAGSWQQQQHGYAGAGANKQKGIAPAELVEKVRPLRCDEVCKTAAHAYARKFQQLQTWFDIRNAQSAHGPKQIAPS